MTSETMPKEHKRRSGWLSQDRRSASCVAEDVVGESGGYTRCLGTITTSQNPPQRFVVPRLGEKG